MCQATSVIYEAGLKSTKAIFPLIVSYCLLQINCKCIKTKPVANIPTKEHGSL